MPILLSILGFGKSAVSYGLQWLSRRSLAEIGCIILALACLFLVVANKAEKRHSAKLQSQVVSLSAELRKLSTAKNEQRVVTREKIKVVLQKQRSADDVAKKIEQAPPAPNCRTKPEIMGADL